MEIRGNMKQISENNSQIMGDDVDEVFQRK